MITLILSYMICYQIKNYSKIFKINMRKDNGQNSWELFLSLSDYKDLLRMIISKIYNLKIWLQDLTNFFIFYYKIRNILIL